MLCGGFCGGGSVLLQKPPSKVEVYNDVDGHVVEFFRVLQTKPWELIAILECMPYSRLLYESFVKLARENVWPKNQVEKVAIWFYLQKTSFSAGSLSGWSHGKTKNEPTTLKVITLKLVEVANRLRDVQIENKDFREAIKIYDSPKTLFYCDPPYFQARSDYYRCGFSMKDHEDLAKILHNIQGKVCLSYYPHPKVDELYRDWRHDSKEVTCCAIKASNTLKPKRTELLLMNY